MIGLVKLLPLVAAISGAATVSPKVKQKINKILNITKVVAIQTEVNNISKMIYLDSIDEAHPKEEDFIAYVRANMKNKKGMSRDTSIDLFGTQYKYDLTQKGFTVTSAGPDKKFKTSDDIYSGYDFY